MKPAPFAYHRPESLAEALGLLQRYGGAARVLAGGQSLMPLINMRRERPAALVDLQRLDELRGWRVADGRLEIGAMTSCAAIERAPEIRTQAGLLSEALPYVGHLAIRSRGTIGGSLAHADPAAELPAIATIYDATFTLAGPNGRRTVRWPDFFVSSLTSCIEPDEILTAVTLTLPAPHTGWHFDEVVRRHGDSAIAGCAVLVRLDADAEVLAEVRVALFGVDATPVRLLAHEPQFAGHRPGAAIIDEIAAAGAATLKPSSDLHGSSAFRRALARRLIADGVRGAVAHARACRSAEAVQ